MRIRIAAAAVTGALALSVVAAGAAAAQQNPRGRVCVAEIDRRVVALDARQQALVSATHLSDADRAALDSNIDTTRSGLRTLRAQIEAETDAAALKSECESIWTGYRVFALVLPRTRLVTVADNEVFAGGRLDAATVKLQDAIDKAKAAGKDVSKAQSDLDGMKAKTASAKASAAGVPASVLPLTPADWNADHDVLKPARDTLKAARDDLKAAGQLAHQVVADLKS